MKAVTCTNGTVVCGERVRVEYLPTEDKKAFHSRLSTVDNQRGRGGKRGGRGNKIMGYRNRSPRRTPPPHSPSHYRSSPPRRHSRSPPHFSRRTPPRHTPPPPYRRTPPPYNRHTPPRRTPPPPRRTPPPSRRTPPRRTPPPSHRTPSSSHYYGGRGSPNYHHRRGSPPRSSDYHHVKDDRHYSSRSRHDSYNHHSSRSSPPPTHHNEYSKYNSRSYNSSSSSSHDYREPSYNNSGRSNDVYHHSHRRDDRYNNNQYSSRSSRRDEHNSYHGDRYKHENPSSRGSGDMVHYHTPNPPPLESHPSPRHYSSSRPTRPISPPSPDHSRDNDIHYRNQRSRKDQASDNSNKQYRSENYRENHHTTPREGHSSLMDSSSQERHQSQRKISHHISRQDDSRTEIRSRSRSPLSQYDNTLSTGNDYLLYNEDPQYSTNHSPHPSFDDNVKLSDDAHFQDYDKSRIKSPVSPRRTDYTTEGEFTTTTTTTTTTTSDDNIDNNDKTYNSLTSDEENFDFAQESDTFNLDNQFFQLEELKGDSAHQEDPADQEPSTFYSEREVTFSPRLEREVKRVSAEREIIHFSGSPSPRRESRSRSGTPTIMD